MTYQEELDGWKAFHAREEAKEARRQSEGYYSHEMIVSRRDANSPGGYASAYNKDGSLKSSGSARMFERYGSF